MSKYYKIQKIFGDNVRNERLRQGLTIEQLAFRSSFPIKNLGVVERGKGNPTLRTISRIARGLHIRTDFLFLLFLPDGKQGSTAFIPTVPKSKRGKLQWEIYEYCQQLPCRQLEQVKNFIETLSFSVTPQQEPKKKEKDRL